MTAVNLADPASLVSNDGSKDELIQRLSGENLALQSVVYGLCMGLAQLSEVHREVVRQVFEYAYAAPRPSHAAGEGQEEKLRERAFRETVDGLKEAVTSRLRRM
jgi:hypothetical protein